MKPLGYRKAFFPLQIQIQDGGVGIVRHLIESVERFVQAPARSDNGSTMILHGVLKFDRQQEFILDNPDTPVR